MKPVDTERKREIRRKAFRGGWEEKFMAGTVKKQKQNGEEFLFPLDSYNMVRYARIYPRREMKNMYVRAKSRKLREIEIRLIKRRSCSFAISLNEQSGDDIRVFYKEKKKNMMFIIALTRQKLVGKLFINVRFGAKKRRLFESKTLNRA